MFNVTTEKNGLHNFALTLSYIYIYIFMKKKTITFDKCFRKDII